MNKSGFISGGNAEGPDKVDMSLDDIIRLNKKQKQFQSHSGRPQEAQAGREEPLKPGQASGGTTTEGSGDGHLYIQHIQQPPSAGLLLLLCTLCLAQGHFSQGLSVLGIEPATFRSQGQFPDLQPTTAPRTRPFVVRREAQHRQTHIPAQRWQDTHKGPTRRPFQLRRKWNPPPVHEQQREARQATFLSRRGLKVQAHVQKSTPAPSAQRTQRTRPWRTPLTSSGILTVSIDNPTARTQPEPAHSWSLHPPSPAPAPATAPPAAEEPERKPPKGVALQFDINSVGKQTAMTLNERFRILKDKRIAAAKQSSKGGRFVTVGYGCSGALVGWLTSGWSCGGGWEGVLLGFVLGLFGLLFGFEAAVVGSCESCSLLARLFSTAFSRSSTEFLSYSSLICSFSTSTSSRTAYIRWLFTRSCAERDKQNLGTASVTGAQPSTGMKHSGPDNKQHPQLLQASPKPGRARQHVNFTPHRYSDVRTTKEREARVIERLRRQEKPETLKEASEKSSKRRRSLCCVTSDALRRKPSRGLGSSDPILTSALYQQDNRIRVKQTIVTLHRRNRSKLKPDKKIFVPEECSGAGW
ncbi:hypothetical protein MHYP_G00001090 [Metynnis hypsauchen]